MMELTLDKVKKGMDGWLLFSVPKQIRKELLALPDATKMTDTELLNEFWAIQHRFDNELTQEDAEGWLGQRLLIRQQFLSRIFEEKTGVKL
jgi:hypothetical protein